MFLKGKDHPNWKGGISFYKEYKNLRLKNWRHENEISKFYIGECRKNPEEIKRNRRIRRKLYKYNLKKAGKLTVETIQGVYEDNIKKYKTLTCYLCEQPILFGKDHLEHKTPLSRGGTNDRENLDIACQKCNYKKHNKTEEEYRKEFSKMKTMMILILLALMVMPFAKAQETAGPELNLQQGAVMTWDGQVKNMTGSKLYELVDDKPISGWPNWAKALLVGDCVSVAWSGDKANWQAASVLFGRKLGTVSNYLPFIKWQLLDKFDVHFYPVGLYLEKTNDIDDKSRIKFKGATGLSVLSITAKF